MKVYILFVMQRDAEQEEWPMVEKIFSTREKAEEALAKIQEEERVQAEKCMYDYPNNYEIEEREVE